MSRSIFPFNDNQRKIEKYLHSEDRFAQGIETLITQSSLVHPSETAKHGVSYEDEIWSSTSDSAFRRIPEGSMNSIAWHLWHSARIEDMALSVILGGTRQVLEKGGYKEKLGVPFAHTGNDMTEKEMKVLDSHIDLPELRRYRIAVGRASCAAFAHLEPHDMNRKVSVELLRMLLENGDIQHESKWLADFWGRKTVFGMIKMPLTRHLMVHINKARRLMEAKTDKEPPVRTKRRAGQEQ